MGRAIGWAIATHWICGGLVGAALVACNPEEADPSPQTPVSVVQNNYTTNVYAAPEAAFASALPSIDSPAAAPASRAPVSNGRFSSGFATCDAYFSETERCASSLTSSPIAIERLEKSLGDARNEARRVADQGETSAKADVATRCEAALRAYDDVPCILRR